MDTSNVFEGGCLCGAVRYRATGHLGNTSACHCRHCQRVSGAPFVAWVAVRREALEWTRGEPRAYEHESDWPTPIRRRFCGSCGSTLTYEREGESELDIATSSLDNPDLIAPDRHVYIGRKHAWIELADELPRFETASQRPSRD